MKKLLLMVLCLCLLLGITGCGAPAAGVSATCAELADSVEKAVAFTELTDVSQDYMEKYLWIEAADLEDWVMRRDDFHTQISYDGITLEVTTVNFFIGGVGHAVISPAE